MVRLHEGQEMPDCTQTFKRDVTITPTSLSMKAYCMESEDDISIYEMKDL